MYELSKLRPMGKKADLSLSINAIVILILAITVMGLGLTFIRGLFKGATEKLGGALSELDITNPPSLEEPLTIDKTISLSPGDKKTVQVGIYNPSTQNSVDGAIPVVGTCVDSSGAPTALDTFTLAAPPQNIEPRGIKGYNAILTATDGIVSDTYICTIGVTAVSDPDSVAGQISSSTFIEVK